MAFDPAPEPAGVGLGDISFAARVGHCLFQEIGAASGLKQVGYGSFDRRDQKTFLDGDVGWGKIAVVQDDALWCSPA